MFSPVSALLMRLDFAKRDTHPDHSFPNFLFPFPFLSLFLRIFHTVYCVFVVSVVTRADYVVSRFLFPSLIFVVLPFACISVFYDPNKNKTK